MDVVAQMQSVAVACAQSQVLNIVVRAANVRLMLRLLAAYEAGNVIGVDAIVNGSIVARSTTLRTSSRSALVDGALVMSIDATTPRMVSPVASADGAVQNSNSKTSFAFARTQ